VKQTNMAAFCYNFFPDGVYRCGSIGAKIKRASQR
jgi:hypothetical protein